MYSGPVIDCDVHHARSTDAELIPYLSKGSRDYVTGRRRRATKGWGVERWPSQESRLFSSIMVGSQLPEVAADEVRRHAANPRMVQVMLVDNPFNRGFGHPIFHPIHAAAEETGRPVAIHGGAGGRADNTR